LRVLVVGEIVWTIFLNRWWPRTKSLNGLLLNVSLRMAAGKPEPDAVADVNHMAKHMGIEIPVP